MRDVASLLFQSVNLLVLQQSTTTAQQEVTLREPVQLQELLLVLFLLSDLLFVFFLSVVFFLFILLLHRFDFVSSRFISSRLIFSHFSRCSISMFGIRSVVCEYD